ncbi:MAG: hypothetical protein QF733_02575 [Phycisphaerales bacterium]|nr:hypothetical protein [Phycisphaerales bacterium]
MMTRRTVQHTLLATLALATAGAVMAARPGATGGSHHAATPPTAASPQARSLEIPADLQRHRLKIRLHRDLGARVLPDGQLFSMKGKDLTALKSLLDRLDVTLTPAISISEADIQRARRRAERGGGGTLADLGATFWADAPARDIERVAKRLNRAGEIEYIRFSRRTGVDAPAATPRKPAERPIEPWVAGPIDTGADDALVILEPVADFDEAQRLVEDAAVELFEIRRDAVARANADNRRREAERRGNRNAGQDRVGACCFLVYVKDIVGRGPAWVAGYNLDLADEDDCEAYVNGSPASGYPGVYADLALAAFDPPQPNDLDYVDPVYEYFADGNQVQCRTFGACCTGPGLRGGEDTYADDCDDPGIFQARQWAGTDPAVDPGTANNNWYAGYKAYDNCDSCVLSFGICCFREEAVSLDTTDFTAGTKFSQCNAMSATTANAPGVPAPVTDWPGAMIPNLTTWGQPAMYPGSLAAYTGYPESATIDFMPQWQGFGLEVGADPWTGSNPYWKGSSSPGGAIVIGNSRFMTNSNAETACERCVNLGGAFLGGVNPADPASYPNLFFDGTFACGDPGGYIIDCLTGAVDPEIDSYRIGSCASAGEATVTSLSSCNDTAESLGLPTGANNPCWLGNMIDPNLLVPDPATGALVHRIHQNQYRPTWCTWFTPPANSLPDGFDPTLGFYSWCSPINPGRPDAQDPLCVGDQPEFIVPPWEYIGTYVEWTGWDPPRWYDEITTLNRAETGDPTWQFLNLTEDEFLEWYPTLDGSEGLYPGATSEDFPGIRDPGHYGQTVSFAIPPTCLEFEGSLGLATQRGVSLPWDTPEGESLWPVYPGWNRWVHWWQMQNSDEDFEDPLNQQVLYPWNDGWNRWMDTVYLFDIGEPTPYPVFHGKGRYLNHTQRGTTPWEYMGDQVATPDNSGDSYIWPNQITTAAERVGNPVYGSCYFPHSATFPTLIDTYDNEAYPTEQECYIGNYCDETSCCEAVEAIVPGCCPVQGGGDVWDEECAQVALDLYLQDRGTAGLDFADYTCRGITPFLSPEYPDWESFQPEYVWPEGAATPEVLYALGQYNADPRNIRLDPMLEATLPNWIDPTAAGLPPCSVADTSIENALKPGLPVPPTDAGYDDYAQVRMQAGRLYQFAPRCQGILSSAGQCNVPGSQSGKSAWSEVAEDESLLVGCQDYDCCMRVIATLLQEKDAASDGDLYSDAEWVDFGHMGVPVGAPTPPLTGQWTPYMAMTARTICYPSVNAGTETPDFFPLQLNAGVKGFRQEYGSLSDDYAEWIQGPDGSRVSDGLTDEGLPNPLSQLIWAPLSWSNPTAAGTDTCGTPHQNIYGMCPSPWYAADGMAMWPEVDPLGPAEYGTDPPDTWTARVNALADSSGVALNAYGEGVNIAVLGEAAWLQAGTPFNPGGVHEDLENVILEGQAIGLPDITLDFSDPEATARCTAVLGVIAATANDFGVTGMAHAATTMFFPTRTLPSGSSSPAERMEDAFFHAMSVLDVGDVLVLAFRSSGGDDFLLSDPEVLPLIELAAASGIHVFVPAGDAGVAMPGVDDFTGADNVSVIAAATPSSEDNYARWWSSNYAEIDTVTPGTPSPLTASLCAWGGGVTTTGGNANLSLLTIDGAATVATNGTYTLTEAGRTRSYTNDFGAQLDGSIAATAQVAAAAASAQSFCRQWYGERLLPSVLIDRLYSTAIFGNAGGIATGVANPAGALGRFDWDLDQAEPENRFVGRMPQLGRLFDDLVSNVPEDDDFGDELPFRIIRMDMITGDLLDGTRFSVELEGDDEWAQFRSWQVGFGSVTIPTGVYVPGPIYYPDGADVVDVQFTCEIGEDVIGGADFGIDTTRSGPDVGGQYAVWVYSFRATRWISFVPETTPAGDPPTEYNALPFGGAPPGIEQYLEPGTNRMYIRTVTRANEPVPYQWYMDYLTISDLISPRPPG